MNKPGYFKNYYKLNQDKEKERVRKHKQANVARINEVIQRLKSVPCTDCKKQYNHWQMDFDHLPEYQKHANVARMLSSGTTSLKTILREIAKCEVVCSNCHRDRTYRRSAGMAR